MSKVFHRTPEKTHWKSAMNSERVEPAGRRILAPLYGSQRPEGVFYGLVHKLDLLRRARRRWTVAYLSTTTSPAPFNPIIRGPTGVQKRETEWWRTARPIRWTRRRGRRRRRRRRRRRKRLVVTKVGLWQRHWHRSGPRLLGGGLDFTSQRCRILQRTPTLDCRKKDSQKRGTGGGQGRERGRLLKELGFFAQRWLPQAPLLLREKVRRPRELIEKRPEGQEGSCNYLTAKSIAIT